MSTNKIGNYKITAVHMALHAISVEIIVPLNLKLVFERPVGSLQRGITKISVAA